MPIPASRLAVRRRTTAGQAAVLLLIVLAILGGIVWWLFSSRAQAEADARAFGKEAATRFAYDFDQKFLSAHLGKEAQMKYPPSFRDRFFERLRRLGKPTGGPDVQGDVLFTSQFFLPVGEFSCHLQYPNAPAIIALGISRPTGRWQIDYINLTWTPPGEPAAPAPDFKAPPTS